MENLNQFLFISGIIIIISGLYAGNYYYTRKKAQELANFLSLKDLTQGFFGLIYLSGKLRNRKVLFQHKWRRGYRNSKVYYTHITIPVNTSSGLKLSLSPEVSHDSFSYGFLNKLVEQIKIALNRFEDKILSRKEIVINDQKFDRAFAIYGGPQDLIRHILSKPIRNQMLQLKSPKKGWISINSPIRYFSLEINRNGLRFTRDDTMIDKEYYARVFKLLLELAETIENEGTESSDTRTQKSKDNPK
ncbi:MAG: hypothetical protein ACQETH_13485 [Candidatus Rifleibacteriota bacterium]